jgi:hypothetical protein
LPCHNDAYIYMSIFSWHAYTAIVDKLVPHWAEEESRLRSETSEFDKNADGTRKVTYSLVRSSSSLISSTNGVRKRQRANAAAAASANCNDDGEENVEKDDLIVVELRPHAESAEGPAERKVTSSPDPLKNMNRNSRNAADLASAGLAPLSKSFLHLSSKVSVGTLKKLLARQFGLSSTSNLELACNGERLGTDHSLHFVFKTRWHNPAQHLVLTYRLLASD